MDSALDHCWWQKQILRARVLGSFCENRLTEFERARIRTRRFYHPVSTNILSHVNQQITTRHRGPDPFQKSSENRGLLENEAI